MPRPNPARVWVQLPGAKILPATDPRASEAIGWCVEGQHDGKWTCGRPPGWALAPAPAKAPAARGAMLAGAV